MKLIKYTISGLLILVLLVIGAAGVMLATFDPNDYKGKIIDTVQESTGRTLTLDGEIGLTFYPVFGFDVQQASLSNPATFDTNEFASIDELQIGVKLIPLFSRSIEFDSIRLVKPKINVIRQANGTTNLDFNTKNKTAATNGSTATQSSSDDKSNDFSVSAGKIEVADAAVNYTDKATGSSYMIEPFNFSMSSFSFQNSSSMNLDAVIKMAQTEIKIDLSGDVLLNKDETLAELSNVSSTIDLINESLSKKITIKAQSDKAVLNFSTQTAQINTTKIKWDNTNIDIDGSYNWGNAPTAKFTLNANEVDIDKILNVMATPQTSATKKKPVQNAPSPSTKTSTAAQLPVDMIRNLSADGTISIDTIKAYGLTFTDLKADIGGSRGIIDLNPMSMNLYDGTLSASARLDARSGTLRVSEQGKIDNVKMGSLLEDFLGKEYITGRAGIEYNINSTGNTVQALMASSGGDISLRMGEGYVKHWQLSKRISQAIAFFNSGKVDENADDEIKFTTMTASFQGQNGVFNNSDLMLIGPKTHALGNGQVDLANKTVNYTVRVGLGDNPEEFAGADHLPVTMTGPFSNMRYGIDVQSLVMDQAGEKIEEKKQELLGKAFEKLGIKTEQPATATPEASEATPPSETTETPATNEEQAVNNADPATENENSSQTDIENDATDKETAAEEETEDTDPAEQLMKAIFDE